MWPGRNRDSTKIIECMRLVCFGPALTTVGAGWEAHRRSTAPGGHTRIIFSFQLGAKHY